MMWRAPNPVLKLLLIAIVLHVLVLLLVVMMYQYTEVHISLTSSSTDRPHSSSVEKPSIVEVSSSGSKSYMLSLHYAEQLTMATVHYVEFINLIADWNLTGVEPYVFNSRMFGLRYFPPITNFTEYSLLFNTSILNVKLSSCLQRATDADKGRPVLFDSISEFMSHSYRNIVIVYFIKHMQILPREIHTAMDSGVTFRDEPIADCTDTARDKNMSHQVEKLLAQELELEGIESYSDDDKFRVVQAFCVKEGAPISLIQLRDYVLSHNINGSQDGRKLNVSILFISWQGRFTHTFTDLHIMNKCKFSASSISYSKNVLDWATQYIHSLNLHESSYISVHIRFEHLFMHHRADPEMFYKCCMKKLEVLLGVVHQKYSVSSNSTLVMTDFGTYGSDSCHYDGGYKKRSLCVEHSNKLLSQINLTPAKFDPKVYDAPFNSGFVSLVEAASLLNGEALITLGGGTYQATLVDHFVRHKSNSESVGKRWYGLQCKESPDKGCIILY